MIPVRYTQYSFGHHRIFYVTEGGGDLVSPPTVKCYYPNKECKMTVDKETKELKRIDTGIYYFVVDFECQGNHLIVFYEGEQKTGILNAIVRPY